MTNITSVAVVPWDVPMRSPYRSAQRITTVAQNILVRITLEDGTIGWGESSPATYVTGETQESVAAAAQELGESLRGLSSAEAVIARLAEAFHNSPGTASALEMACLDAFSRSQGVPLFTLLPTLFGEQLTTPSGRISAVTDLSLPIIPPDVAAERAAEFASLGFRSFKIKVGKPDRDEDEARVRAVASAAPQATLRIDGNQAFDPHDAIAFVERLSDLIPRLEIFEQPTPADDHGAMRIVQAGIPIPVFADESVHNAEDARHLVGEGICSGVVLKLAKSGLRGAWQIARAVQATGGKCLFGCMMETRLGITAALSLAVALGPEVVPMLDLDGHMLVDDSALVSGGLIQEGDVLSLDPSKHGLGVVLI